MGEKRIFISDVHLGAGKFKHSDADPDPSDRYPHEWDWLSTKETENFEAFITFLCDEYIDEIKEVVLLGDIFDNWVFPHDLVPPTMDELLKQEKNKPVVAKLNQLADQTRVFFVPGNHDMGANRQVIKRHFEKFKFCEEQFVAGRLIAEHGHRYALFNAPPNFSPNLYGLPLGYFISRVQATRKGLTDKDGRKYHTYLDDLLEVLGPQRLPESVFEAVLEEGGLDWSTEFAVRNKQGNVEQVSAERVRETYKNLYEDWPEALTSKTRAIFAELNRLEPIADKLCKHGRHNVAIMGHSHKADLDKDTWFVDDRIYANAGFWCGRRCTFVETEKYFEDTKRKQDVRIMRWSGSNNAAEEKERATI